MKKRKIIIVGVIILILAILFSFLKINYDKYSNISLIDVNNSVWLDSGFKKETEYNNVSYYFSDEDEKQNKELVFKVDNILKKSNEKFNLKIAGKVKYFFINDSDNIPKTYSPSSFIIRKNFYSIGAILNSTADFKLPAWLSVGIELYFEKNNEISVKNINSDEISTWIDKSKEESLPSFGDIWFIPDLIDNPINENIWNIAYSFVNHLDKKQTLSKIVSLFVEDDKEQAQTLINEEWMDFTKRDSDELDFSYKFSYFNDDIRFEVHTNKADYQFYANDWSYETICSHLNRLENAIKYVEDWFGQELSKITCKIRNAPGFSYCSGSTIELYHFDKGVYYMTHETVHAISFQLKINLYSFTPFTEGLANVVQFSFDESNNETHLYDLLKEGSILEAYEETKELEKFNVIENNNKFSKNIYDKDGKFNAYQATMSLAFHQFQFDDDFKFNERLVTTIPDLNTYTKASSFIFYLIEKYGKDDFMKVYFGTSTFEEVYGEKIEEVVNQWKSYLGV